MTGEVGEQEAGKTYRMSSGDVLTSEQMRSVEDHHWNSEVMRRPSLHHVIEIARRLDDKVAGEKIELHLRREYFGDMTEGDPDARTIAVAALTRIDYRLDALSSPKPLPGK